MADNRTIQIKLNDVILPAYFLKNRVNNGLIIFSQESGNMMQIKRNYYIAKLLQDRGFEILFFELLTDKEDHAAQVRFNINLLAKRLAQVIDWVGQQDTINNLPIGIFGTSYGSASALQTTVERSGQISVMVSHEGRPDMAIEALPEVTTPVLFIVDELDKQLIDSNSLAYHLIKGRKKMEILSNTIHLTEEPWLLQKVANLAADWYNYYLRSIN